MFDRVISTLKESVGEQHPDYASALHNRAAVFSAEVCHLVSRVIRCMWWSPHSRGCDVSAAIKSMLQKNSLKWCDRRRACDIDWGICRGFPTKTPQKLVPLSRRKHAPNS